MENVKRIPYGVSDYRRVIQENMYYVDKTAYIQLLESTADFMFMIRPRRFGKSLFLSMMRYYYGVEYKDDFDRLFGQTWIGQHPTPTHNTYQLLYLDFSRTAAPIDQLENRFNEYCNVMLNGFMDRYRDCYEKEVVRSFYEIGDSRRKLDILNEQAQLKQMPLYLIIDEYDNFTNVVLSQHGEKVYHDLTHASGFFRDYFKLFKGMFTRIYMTGVSPVTLDDLSSGYNIDWNISNEPVFNAMLGFSESDVMDMFNYYQEAGQLKGDIPQMVEEMKPWYDNYCFSDACLNDDKMFNCDMVLYYLLYRTRYGVSPQDMVDKNIRTDYKKLKMLAEIDRDAKKDDRMTTIEEILTSGEIKFPLNTSFPAQDIMNGSNYNSLLYYYGMLTMKRRALGGLVFGIPNKCVEAQYFSYIERHYKDTAIREFGHLDQLWPPLATDGGWEEFFKKTSEIFKANTSVRTAIRGEATLQGFYYGIFGVKDIYVFRPELELNKGYCDIFLLPNTKLYPGEIHHSYLIELKYAKPTDTDERVRELADEGRAQLRQYSDDQLAELTAHDVTLHRLLLVYRGWDNEVMEEVDK